MNRVLVKAGVLTLLIAFSFISLTSTGTPQESASQVNDAQLQEVYGEGCLTDCALAATYTALAFKNPIYAVLAAIYAAKCASCEGDGSSCTPTVDESEVCQGDVTTAGELECDFYGGQVVYYNDGCQGREICCIEGW